MTGQTHNPNLSDVINEARRELLDLGLRNPLLNYRLLRTRGLEVVDERPSEVYRILVRDERTMTFLPGSDEQWGPQLDENELEQPDETQTDLGERHTDCRLQTSLSSTHLQSRLLATYYAARISLEEQGVNTLYLALGMLRWREDQNSEKFYRAPLILVPVELTRSDVRHRFHLRYTGDELGENVSLVEKLKQSFVIKLPSLPDAEDLDVDAYFAAVQEAVRSQSAWVVERGSIALGFFSFAKFLMYRDLDPKTWPKEQMLTEHPVFRALLGEVGFAGASSRYNEDSFLDDQLAGRELIHVADADSSQTLAILEALEGHNMVIQGPPGTGKSQTIVNLIAAALSQGKTVLFVSEKMAALEVVKRRLDAGKLGPACLELHSNKTNKKAVIDELKRTFSLGSIRLPSLEVQLALLEQMRTRLNEYCKAVNQPIRDSGETPSTAYGKLLRCQERLCGIRTPALAIAGVTEWTSMQTALRTRMVEELQDRISRSGVPSKHSFWGSRRTILLPTDLELVREVILGAQDSAFVLEHASGRLAHLLGTAPPATPFEAQAVLNSAQSVVTAPDLAGLNSMDPEWRTRAELIQSILQAGRGYSRLHRQQENALRPEAWKADVAEARRDFAELGQCWWRFLSRRWLRARRTLKSLCRFEPPISREAQLELLDAILESQRLERSIAAAQPTMQRLYRDWWRGVESDWDLLEQQATWIRGAQEGIEAGTLLRACLDPERFRPERPMIRQRIKELEAAQCAFTERIRDWSEQLELDETLFIEGPLVHQPFHALAKRWRGQAAGLHELHTLVAFNQAAAECEREQLGSVVAAATRWENAATHLVPLYERTRLSVLLDVAFRERPRLAAFDGPSHSKTVEDFRRLDLQHLEYCRTLLAARHIQGLPVSATSGQLGTLCREFERKRGFLPIRTLMLKAGNAVQAIKPVFMMSPLSIANYLPPGAVTFDLVIFDEASQVKPVDAMGAIARGTQTVVVGDSKQLPPTTFFENLAGQEDYDEEKEESATADIESILGLFCSRRAPQRMLRWHYRSRHESLITVSNHLFYDDKLVVFPSPQRERTEVGLIYHYIENAHYDRSRTRTNPVEAKVVAEEVMEHARKQLRMPVERRETLGVAAFSSAQADAILRQVEFMRRSDPSCEEFFASCPYEPFFVKNLENVQGDERDVIFISIGYARAADGYLAMSFGPLNRNGGERRLNVLVTRARKRCKVFSALKAEDIDLSRTTSEGAKALKMFLSYAETGRLDLPRPSGDEPQSDFEEEVLRALTLRGYQVHSQIGSAGFFLDLAVADPGCPGRYLLGIECDGARYHSAKSARDRDRLRQEILENLGWRIHRIWSTDWFRNPDKELRRALEAIEAAKVAAGAPDRGSRRPDPTVHPPAPKPLRPPPKARALPYRVAQVAPTWNTELHMVQTTELAALLEEVVRVESPVHWMEAARRVANGAGISKLGNRIQEAFEQAVQLGARHKAFRLRGHYLWRPDMIDAPIRDRRDLPPTMKRIDLVAPEEIRRAILALVEDTLGMCPDEIAPAVCRLLGFGRASEEMRSVVDSQRDALISEGRLIVKGTSLVIRESGPP